MTHMHEGIKFGDLEVGTKFKLLKYSPVTYTKVKPSMEPVQHNTTTQHSYTFHWFDQEETVHVQKPD